VIVVEIAPAINADGVLQTFYLSTDGFQTGPTDTPANTAFLPVLKQPASIGVSAFSEGQTTGSSQLQAGDTKFVNIDGEFDDWKTYGFDGRSVVIRSGQVGAPYPSGFSLIFTGVAASATVGLREVVIKLKDKAHALDRPVLTTQYAGTNAGPVGLEGLPEDIKGRVKPRVYGKVREIAPPLVNASELVYQVNDGPVDDIPGVYDRGAAKAQGADYATSALLMASTPAGATYHTCLAEGLFMVDSHDGLVTADVTESAAAADMTVGVILNRLALASGLTAAEINADDVAQLNFLAPYVVGDYIDDDRSFRDEMDRIAASVGAWWAFDASGVLRMGQLAAPSAIVDYSFIEADVLAGFESDVADGDGVPVWRVNVRHTKFYTAQTSDVAGSVSDERRGELAQEYRTFSAEDPSVKFQFLNARELTVDSLLSAEADAETVADMLLALHKVRRDLFHAPVKVDAFAGANTGLIRSVNLTHGRFGLSGGRNLIVLGFDLDLGRKRVAMKLWG